MAKLVSKTYGDALFETGLEDSRIDDLAEEVKAVGDILLMDTELLQLMEHPEISHEGKIDVIEHIFKGRVSDDMVGFLVVVVKKGRYKELSGIFEYFTARYKEYKRVGIASVVSAVSLSDMWKKRIEEKLLSTTGYVKMEINYRIDESLIGGMVIRMGDKVVDSSIKGKLATLTSNLMKVSLEA